MDRIRKKEFPFYYAEGKSLFHVVAKMSDEPGSLSKVLGLLGGRVNLIGTSTYTLEDGSAMLTAFAEGLKQGESESSLKGLLDGSGFTMSAEVFHGEQGILVDTFHTGVEAHGDEMMVIRRKALVGMLARICRLLGSGGETLLYEQGKEIGRINTEQTIRIVGMDRTLANISYLRKWLAAIGWGEVHASNEEDGTHFTVKDCFECSSSDGHRTGCHFFRGYIAGSRVAQHGSEPRVKETKCRLRGDHACEFVVAAP